MKFKTKNIILTDGSTAYDVNIFPNNNNRMNPKVIISCISEDARTAFLTEFQDLLYRYTVEALDD